MAFPLPAAEVQFCDSNGAPLAGGTLGLFQPGSTWPKASWLDANATVLNTQPIVLDSAGRAIVYGDGAYRMVLSDALGNLIWDQVTTTVSLAMAPVVTAPTLALARSALGVGSELTAAAETTARITADSAEIVARNAAILVETNARIAADSAEALARFNADTAEANFRVAGDVGVIQQIGMAANFMLFSQGITSAGGTLGIVFAKAFSSPPRIWMTCTGSAQGFFLSSYNVTTAGFTAYSSLTTANNAPAGPVAFNWLAIGTL